MAYGKIVCFPVFLCGNILIPSFVQGRQLSSLWNDLTLAEKKGITPECNAERQYQILHAMYI